MSDSKIEMLKEKREKRKQYLNKYREDNKDKHIKWCREYRIINKEKIQSYNKEYRENNKEKLKSKSNEQIICVLCNKIIKRNTKYMHAFSKKHIKNLENETKHPDKDINDIIDLLKTQLEPTDSIDDDNIAENDTVSDTNGDKNGVADVDIKLDDETSLKHRIQSKIISYTPLLNELESKYMCDHIYSNHYNKMFSVLKKIPSMYNTDICYLKHFNKFDTDYYILDRTNTITDMCAMSCEIQTFPNTDSQPK